MLYRDKKEFYRFRLYSSLRLKSISIARNMKEYANFPPFESLKRILQSAPQCALLFISLWNLKPKLKSFSIKKKDIKKTFLVSPTLFRNHLLSFGRLDLLTFEETTEFFLIDFYEN